MPRTFRIAPSLLSADFARLGAEVQDVAFDGNQIYAIAWIGDAKVDSVFAVGKLDGSGKITNAVGEKLENKDAVTTSGDGSVHFFAVTSTDVDGITFDTAPGAVVELEAYLDGQPDPRFIYWFGDQILHAGSPTDPVDFAPSAP